MLKSTSVLNQTYKNQKTLYFETALNTMQTQAHDLQYLKVLQHIQQQTGKC